MDKVSQFASNAAIVAATAGFPVYALDSAADSFELACEIAVGSVHAWTPEDVVKNDNGLRTLVLGIDVAQDLADQDYKFAGPVVLITPKPWAAVWRLAGAIRPAAVIVHSADDHAGLAAKLRPFLGA